MYKLILALSILLLSKTNHAQNYVYVPQDIQKFIAQGETVLSITYGPLTDSKALDAVIVSMASKDAQQLNYDFTKLYKYPRKIYILQNQDQKQWKLIAKNSLLLKALDEDIDYIQNVDTTFFRTDDNKYLVLDVGREGKNHALANSIGNFKIRFSPKTNQAYIVNESYVYSSADGEENCHVSKDYSLGKKEFSTFRDNENNLIKELISKQKCG